MHDVSDYQPRILGSIPVPDSVGQELVQATGYGPCAIGTVGDHGVGE